MIEVRARGGHQFGDVIDIHIFDREAKTAVRKVVSEPHQEGEFLDPAIRMDKHLSQQLMDDLWQAGLRPSEGTGSAGSLKATETHLKDMRKLVSKQLDVELV